MGLGCPSLHRDGDSISLSSNGRCLTTRDGTWNAIVATNVEKTRGEVHCYPTDNDESRIYKGILAAFTQAQAEDGSTVTFVAVVNVADNEASLPF